MTGARKPAYHYFYILTHSTRPGNLDPRTDARIRFMQPWIMREFSKCKVLFKAFDSFNISHKKKLIYFQIQVCLSLEYFSIRSVPSMANSKIIFQSLTFTFTVWLTSVHSEACSLPPTK